MSIHYKVGGLWQTVERPYRKVSGKWRPVKEVWVKHGGNWTRVYEYDVIPPDVPVISLEIIDTVFHEKENGETVRREGRHIKVGVRSPGASHDPDLQMIRVLARQADGKPPSTQFGATYISGRDDNYPEEAWSDFSYNGFNGSRAEKDSSEFHYKQYPRNATESSELAAGVYYFTAWARDDAGNWSAGNPAEITVPKKGTDAANIRVKEAKIQCINAGTVDATGFTSGALVQQTRPVKRGVWFYGNQIPLLVGEQGKAEVRNAQILIHRRKDTGEAQANLYLYWHEYAATDQLPTDEDTMNRRDITKIGTIGKGESKWFKLPASHIAAIEADNLKGFGLNMKSPDAAQGTSADYSVIRNMTENLRTGEVNLVWTEKLWLPAEQGNL